MLPPSIYLVPYLGMPRALSGVPLNIALTQGCLFDPREGGMGEGGKGEGGKAPKGIPTQCFHLIIGFFSSDTHTTVMGRFLHLLWYDLNGTPERHPRAFLVSVDLNRGLTKITISKLFSLYSATEIIVVEVSCS